MTGSWSPEKSQKIIKRIVVETHLILKTPAHFGNGDNNEQTDMTLLLDEATGKPLLPGASIAGALRAYLEMSYGNHPMIELLFGNENEDIGQSALIVHDSYAKEGTQYEIRDGVKLNPQSRTAEDNALYNLSYWEAGTVFPLRFELLITENRDSKSVKQAFVAALMGLENGNITLGARKNRGFGEVGIDSWCWRVFDFSSTNALIDWLYDGDKTLTDSNQTLEMLADELDVEVLQPVNSLFSIDAYFKLPYTMLIRSSRMLDTANEPPDMVHLQSRRSGVENIISGTTVAGAMRARAHQIVKFCYSEAKAFEIVSEIFGGEDMDGNLYGSRLRTYETVITRENIVDDLVQTRVSIDRFTGGALNTALFTQRPVFGKDDVAVNFKFDLYEATDAEIGLLLLILKDFWTEDIVLGGERSVGRGRLHGISATIYFQDETGQYNWRLSQSEDNLLNILPHDGINQLEYFVEKFNQL